MIAIVQPFIPHYREPFFEELSKRIALDIYCYEVGNAERLKYKVGNTSFTSLQCVVIKGVLFYKFGKLLSSRYSHLVLMLHPGHFTTWLLLFSRPFHKKKIILWGQGISVKRFLKESDRPDWKIRWMLQLSNGAWFYTSNECQFWSERIRNSRFVSIDNTVDVSYNRLFLSTDKALLKRKFNIVEQRVVIFCARFENAFRRNDILVEVINILSKWNIGVIIIGDGSLKPDFSRCFNVYDFGMVYDKSLKDELFQVADIYFQPAWVGLSIVESMAYGLPVLTFKRSVNIRQCVEYFYLTQSGGSKLVETVSECIDFIVNTPESALMKMSSNSRSYYNKYLTISNMADKAMSIL